MKSDPIAARVRFEIEPFASNRKAASKRCPPKEHSKGTPHESTICVRNSYAPIATHRRAGPLAVETRMGDTHTQVLQSDRAHAPEPLLTERGSNLVIMPGSFCLLNRFCRFAFTELAKWRDTLSQMWGQMWGRIKKHAVPRMDACCTNDTASAISSCGDDFGAKDLSAEVVIVNVWTKHELHP